MLKKIYTTILVFLVTAFSIYAQNPEVKIHDVLEGPGQITVPVDMLDFTQEVNSFTFKITADEALLDFVEVSNVVGFSSANIQSFQNGSTLTVTWFDPNGYQPDGHVFDLIFDYTGTANTSLAFQDGENEVTYGIFNVPNVVYTDGLVTTTEPLPDPVVKIQDVVSEPGVVNVPMEMLYFEQTLNSFEFHIEIENEALEFVQLDNVVSALQGDVATNYTGNEIIITWFNAGAGFTPSGHVFDLVFNYTGGFPCDLTWGSGNEVISGVSPVENVGYVQGSVMQTAPPDGSVTLEPQDVMTGSQFDMPVNFSGDGFGNVAAFTLKMTFNTNKLNFQGINSAVVNNINASQNGNVITLQWFGSAQDFTDTDVVNLSFIYTGVSATTIAFQPGSEVNNEIAQPLSVDYNNGTVSPQVADETFKISDVEAFAGQTVTVPITATDIGDVGAIDLNIEFDNTTLSFGDWDAVQLSGWEFNQNAGELSFGWFGSGTINEGAVIDLHFVYNGGGDGPINFMTGSEITGPLGTTIPTNFEDGGLTQATSDSQAEIASVTACDQNIAVVPVTLADVDLISGFDLEIGFNTAALDFVELQNVNPDITDYNINPNDDVISLNWQTTAGGIDANGVLFEMVFNYLGSYSEITFNSGSEFINAIGATLPVQFIDGEIDCNLDQRTLTLNYAGNGNVVVKEDGTELEPDQGSDNQYTVLWGTTLSLEAFGDEGWQFDLWEGAVNGSTDNPTTIYMNNNYGVTANFSMIDYDLGLDNMPAEGGSTTGAGVYNFQDNVTLEAAANEGWSFINWTNDDGNVLSSNNPYVYIMPSNDTAFVANYEMIDYNLTVAAVPSEAGSVVGGGVYNFEDEVTVEATEAEGWAFLNWTNAEGDIVSTDLTYAFSMPSSDLDLTANFELIDYNVSLSVNPTDAGTVSGGGVYNMGDEVIVSATANTGYSFVNWTNGAGTVVSNDASYTFDMPASDLELTANFTPNDYNVTLEADPAEGGSVTGEGVYPYGSSVTVSATANTGYSFVNWTNGAGTVVSNDASYTFDMPASDLELTANFTPNDYNVTLEADPAEGGSVTGEGLYTYGSSVTVSATPNTGYSFVSWTNGVGTEVSTDASYTFDMPASDVELTANFELTDYNVTLTSVPAEGGTLSGSGIYNMGDDVVVSATPNTGYSFVNWTNDNGEEVSSNVNYFFTMPASDVELTANFELTDYNVTLTSVPAEGGTLSGSGVYNMGDEVAVLAEANEGFSFVNWTDEDGTEVSTTVDYTFTMPASDVELTANFEANEYVVSVFGDPAESGTVTGGGTYAFGSSVTVEATPIAGWSFDGWIDGEGTVVSTEASYTFDMPANDISLTAQFEVTAFTLTLIANPTEGGTVFGAGNFDTGEEATIVATPNDGYSFINWTDAEGGVVSTNESYTFNMPPEDVTYTANFELNDYTVTLLSNPEEGGEVSGGGVYSFGSSVTVEATPSENYSFVGWTDSDGTTISEEAEYTFNMPSSDVELTANFEVVAYELTLEASPVDGGLVFGAGNYTEGEVISIAATSNDDFSFVNWTNSDGEVVSEDAFFEFTMPSNDVTLTANFEPLYTLNLEVNPSEAGAANGEGQYVEGEEVDIVASPNEGWEFVNWTNEDGEVVSTDAFYVFTMPGNNATLTANFVEGEYSVIVAMNISGAGLVDGSGTFTFGEEVTVTAQANVGYTFINWTNNAGVIVSENAEYTFNMPAEDIVLTANFEANEYELSLEPNPSEGGTVEGDGIYAFGSEVTIVATPALNWSFLNWTDEDGNILSEEPSYSFDMPSSDITYTANFEDDTWIGNEFSKDDLLVYPNPADDRLVIELKGNIQDMEHLYIFDAVGNQVKALGQDSLSEKFSVNISNLKPGIYYLQFKSISGMVSKKIVVL